MEKTKNTRLDKFLFNLFDELIEGAEQYTHNGSLWMIFTDDRKWVFEFTESGTLWYNYGLFRDRMSIMSMDCVEDKQHITKWFEDRFLNKPKAKDTLHALRRNHNIVEHTIETGVKHTSSGKLLVQRQVEDTIQNGVRHTDILESGRTDSVEDTIQNGVKETKFKRYDRRLLVEDTIESGVKDTLLWLNTRTTVVEGAIQNGVKQTKRSYEGSRKQRTNYVIENGVRHTMWSNDDDDVEDAIGNGVKLTSCANSNTPSKIEETIENGVKLTLGERMNRDYSVKDIVENEVKETELHKGNRPFAIRDAIKNGVKN